MLHFNALHTTSIHSNKRLPKQGLMRELPELGLTILVFPNPWSKIKKKTTLEERKEILWWFHPTALYSWRLMFVVGFCCLLYEHTEFDGIQQLWNSSVVLLHPQGSLVACCNVTRHHHCCGRPVSAKKLRNLFTPITNVFKFSLVVWLSNPLHYISETVTFFLRSHNNCFLRNFQIWNVDSTF